MGVVGNGNIFFNDSIRRHVSNGICQEQWGSVHGKESYHTLSQNLAIL